MGGYAGAAAHACVAASGNAFQEINLNSLMYLHGLMYCPSMAHAAEASAGIPPFMGHAGHPIRWGLLRELAGSDLRVRELGTLVGAPQNLVSYHLGKLRAAAMVTMRRSSADGRDASYSIDLARCRAMLMASGEALHPGLSFECAVRDELSSRRTVSVLFACTGNSARSQMAEALLPRIATGVELAVVSGGSRPKPLHPNAVRALGERGIDISGRSSKQLSEFSGTQFDYVVTLCDRVREVCPEFPGHPRVIHWSLADPATEGVSDGETYPAFEQLATELETRLGFLAEVIKQDLNKGERT